MIGQNTHTSSDSVIYKITHWIFQTINDILLKIIQIQRTQILGSDNVT